MPRSEGSFTGSHAHRPSPSARSRSGSRPPKDCQSNASPAHNRIKAEPAPDLTVSSYDHLSRAPTSSVLSSRSGSRSASSRRSDAPPGGDVFHFHLSGMTDEQFDRFISSGIFRHSSRSSRSERSSRLESISEVQLDPALSLPQWREQIRTGGRRPLSSSSASHSPLNEADMGERIKFSGYPSAGRTRLADEKHLRLTSISPSPPLTSKSTSR